MSSSPNNVIVGTAGQNGGPGIAFFAPLGTALPTSPLTSLDPAFKDAGFVSTAGLVMAVAETTSDIPAFGLQSPVRSVTTQSKRTFKVTFLETNPVTLAVYNREPLSAVPNPTGTGIMAVQVGPVLVTRYAAVFDIVDGANRVRFALPQAQVTVITDLNIASGGAVERAVELTAFPDGTGISIYEYDLVAALS